MDSENRALLQGLRVLVVDDDIDSCKLLEFILQEWQMEVQIALSAQEAFKKLNYFQPDIFVIDIFLPQEDGYTFLYKVKQLDTIISKKSLAIAVTADSTQSKQWAIEVGFDQLLFKPLDIDETIQVLANLVQQRKYPPCRCCSGATLK